MTFSFILRFFVYIDTLVFKLTLIFFISTASTIGGGASVNGFLKIWGFSIAAAIGLPREKGAKEKDKASEVPSIFFGFSDVT